MMHLLTGKKNKIFFYFILLLLFSSFNNINLSNFAKKKFKIDDIDIQTSYFEDFDINDLLNKNIFFLNKEKIMKNLNENPILKTFEIKKIYPNKIQIKLEKTKPVAKIISNKSNIYLGDNGKLFNSSKSYDFVPNITGEIDLININKIINILNLSSFKKSRIKQIKIFPSKRFDLIFIDGKILKFPSEINQKFVEDAFKIFINSDFDKPIIDLRLVNKIIVKNE